MVCGDGAAHAARRRVLLHTLEFDGYDGPWEDVDRFADGGKRWRPLR